MNTIGGGSIVELVNFLWTLRTTPKQVTGETPFSLVYGFESSRSNRDRLGLMRITHFEKSANNVEQGTNLDLGDEKH